MESHVRAGNDNFRRLQAVAANDDRPVLMLNLNQYSAEAGFPLGAAYQGYMRALHRAVESGGGRVLWQAPSEGLVIGCAHDDVDEVLAVWYPSHSAFINLPKAEGADEMFAGRSVCVTNASIVALPADQEPLRPSS